MDLSTWPSAHALYELGRFLDPQGLECDPLAYALLASPALVTRLARLETLPRLAQAMSSTCPTGRDPLLHALIFRQLVDARRAPFTPGALEAIERLLALGANDAPPGKTARADLEQLQHWPGAPSPPTNEQGAEYDALRAYLHAIESLATRCRLPKIQDAIRAARRFLAPPEPGRRGYPARVLTVFCDHRLAPRLDPSTWLRGLAIDVDVELRSRLHPGGPRTPHERDLQTALARARAILETKPKAGSEADPWRLAVAIRTTQPSAAPTPGHHPADGVAPHEGRIEGGSAGLPLLAAFHFALGYRNGLPPILGFTGALTEDQRVEPVAHIEHKIGVAGAHGMRRLFVPERNASQPAAQAAARRHAVVLEAVPESVRGAELVSWLEQHLLHHDPTLGRLPRERLVMVFERAQHLVHQSESRRSRAEFEFLCDVTKTPSGPDATLQRNIHAAAWVGIGRGYNHEARSRDALHAFERAEHAFEELLRNQRLLPIAWQSYLDLENLRAVALTDLLQHERACALLERSLTRKRAATPLCSAPLLGATHGSLGQSLTYLGAAQPQRFDEARHHLEEALRLVEPHERPREEVYLATVLLRRGEVTEAAKALESLLTAITEGAPAEPGTDTYAWLRLCEAAARWPQRDALASWRDRFTPAFSACENTPWQRAVLRKWQGVVHARLNGDPAAGEEDFTSARDAFANDDPTHGDRALAAAVWLEETALWAEAGDRSRATTCRERACALLHPFVALARNHTPTAHALATLLQTTANTPPGPPLANACRRLSLLIPY